jgi:hypothetical protein
VKNIFQRKKNKNHIRFFTVNYSEKQRVESNIYSVERSTNLNSASREIILSKHR